MLHELLDLPSLLLDLAGYFFAMELDVPEGTLLARSSFLEVFANEFILWLELEPAEDLACVTTEAAMLDYFRLCCQSGS